MAGIFDPEILLRFWCRCKQSLAITERDHVVSAAMDDHDWALHVGNFRNVPKLVEWHERYFRENDECAGEPALHDQSAGPLPGCEIDGCAVADGASVGDYSRGWNVQRVGQVRVSRIHIGVHILFRRGAFARAITLIVVGEDRKS